MPKAKKRALSTSSESSESDGAEEEKSAEKVKKKVHVEKKVKTAATSSSDEQGKAKKSKKEKQEKPKEVQPIKEVLPPVKEPEKKKPEPEKVIKTTTVKDMLRLKRDNLRKQELGKPTSSGATTATDNDDEDGESESVSSLAVSESSRDSHPETPAPVNGAKEIPLPDNLPADATAIIASLKQSAESSSTKTGFLDVRIMDQLVKVDNITKTLGAAARLQTFNYMAQFMPCTKKTLFEKVRKHRQSQFSSKVKTEVNKLRKVVSEAMPMLISKFDNDMKQYELKRTVQNVVGDTTTENNVPRKKFHWNDVSRKVLSNIVASLEDLHKVTKAKKESSNEFLLLKLKEEVLPLWPEGWMKLEDFEKELEKKKKKDTRVAAAAANAAVSSSQGGPAPQVQTKPITASASAGTKATNGKAQAQKTDANANQKLPTVNGKTALSLEPSISAPNLTSLSPASVIKRSSDHSINSIISASPSPPTTGKAPEATKPRVVELEKLSNPSDLLKVVQSKSSLPRFNSASPIDITTPEKATNSRRSDSSDSDCVEVVSSDFNPIKPEKSHYHNNNNNKVNHHTSHPAPIAKKMKKHGSDDGEQETDYSKIIMGLQSLTVRQSFS
jgi:Ubinuclein conserved middle domain